MMWCQFKKIPQATWWLAGYVRRATPNKKKVRATATATKAKSHVAGSIRPASKMSVKITPANRRTSKKESREPLMKPPCGPELHC